jgi:SpoVK/Ycf46/Vps4 family AAA+-type ATPase
MSVQKAVRPTEQNSVSPSGKPYVRIYMYCKDTKRWEFIEKPPRSWENIILMPEVKNKIKADIMNWVAEKMDYELFDIPYHRGYFFYGPPGTGKTSLAITIASETNRPIYFMPLDDVLDPTIVSAIPKYSIILFEDIDKFISNGKNIKEVVPIATTVRNPPIEPEDVGIWHQAIRESSYCKRQYAENYQSMDANTEVELMPVLVDQILNRMRAGYGDKKTDKDEELNTDKEDLTGFSEIIDSFNKLKRDKFDDLKFDLSRVSFMLQIMDGVITPHGALIVLTTNREENIHKGMLRSGRIDFKHILTFLKEEEMLLMCDRFQIPRDRLPASLRSRSDVVSSQLQGFLWDLRRKIKAEKKKLAK